jgi:prolyl oligopeptidase
MIRFLITHFCIILITVFVYAQTPAEKIIYPPTRKVDVKENYFGTVITDPYRWLENDTAPETAAWVREQNNLTQKQIGESALHDKLKSRLENIWRFERMSVLRRYGSYYFFSKTDGRQAHWIAYAQEGLDGTPRALMDPNKLDSTGLVSIDNTSISRDGKYAAYALSKAGSDWQQIVVVETKTGKLLSDTINWVKLADPEWQGDGFYYAAFTNTNTGNPYSAKNENQKLLYHKLGTPQSSDKVIYEEKTHPERRFSISISDNGKIASLYAYENGSGVLKLKDMGEKTEWKAVNPSYKDYYEVIQFLPDSNVLIRTNHYAPNYRVIKLNINEPTEGHWTEIIAENKDVLSEVTVCGDKIIAGYMHDVTSRLAIYSLTGKYEGDISLPGQGDANVVGNIGDSIAFITYSDYLTPPTIYKYNVNRNTSELYFQPLVDFNPNDYESKQVFYNSHDGIKIPMFIVYKKGTPLNGKAPCILTGYGGFGKSLTPRFQLQNIPFLEAGGIYAVANLRGGGEYGARWHMEGMKYNKQYTFEDFIDAANYLVKKKYSSHQRLAILGASNGGLLVGAVMTQEPGLAKVAIPIAGVMDMLRYQKFTIGYFWKDEYGCSDNEDEFECLVKYSPLHNIKMRNYPATLIFTADHDDRVVPAHSYKFAATLQQNQLGNNPVLLRVQTDAGHGKGTAASKQIEEWADIWSFVFENLGMQY